MKWGLQRLVEQLGENDRVAIVVYAGASGLVLPSTSCINKAQVMSAIDQLQAGGSTNGGAGIQLAYDLAAQNFIKNGTNRVILATDGDFNVGITDDDKLVELIQAKAKSGVFLSVLGFGTGNLKDANARTTRRQGERPLRLHRFPARSLPGPGRGNGLDPDHRRQGRQDPGRLQPGTRGSVPTDRLREPDHGPPGLQRRHQGCRRDRRRPSRDGALRDRPAATASAARQTLDRAREEVCSTPATKAREPLLIVNLRYKKPSEDTSRLIEHTVIDQDLDFGHASDDLKFAAAVAGFGMLLRDSPYKGSLTYDGVLEIAQPSLKNDPSGYRGGIRGSRRQEQGTGCGTSPVTAGSDARNVFSASGRAAESNRRGVFECPSFLGFRHDRGNDTAARGNRHDPVPRSPERA